MSERAKQAARIYFENQGKISKGEACRQAGYSKAQANNPQQISAQIDWIEVEESFADKLDKHIQKALASLDGKIAKASYGEASGGVEKLTKLKELISGRPTAKIGFIDVASTPAPEVKAKLAERISQNSRRK